MSDRGRRHLRAGKRMVELDVSGPLVSNLAALHRGALAGLGIAQLPSVLVQADVEAQRSCRPNAGTVRGSVFAVQSNRTPDTGAPGSPRNGTAETLMSWLVRPMTS